MAMVGDDRYCHGDVSPTCYEMAEWAGCRALSGGDVHVATRPLQSELSDRAG